MARLGQASLTLLAQIDADGNIQKTFRVNEESGERTSLGTVSTGQLRLVLQDFFPEQLVFQPLLRRRRLPKA